METIERPFAGEQVTYAFTQTVLGLAVVASTDKGVAALLVGDSRDGLMDDLRDTLDRAVLEEDAQVLSNTQLQQQLAGETPAVQEEVVRINTEARPIALQVALLVPLIAGLLGAGNALRMRRLPDPKSSSVEGVGFG